MELIKRADSPEPDFPPYMSQRIAHGGAYQGDAPDAEGGIMLRLQRRKLLFASVFIVAIASVAGAYLLLPPTYRAEASVTIVQPERILASQQASDAQQSIGDSSDLESQAVILSSPLMIRELLTRPAIQADLLRECQASQRPEWQREVRDLLHLKPAPACTEQLADLTGLVGSIRGRLGVATNGRSRVINVTFNSPLPDVAKSVADGIAVVYLDSRIREKLQPRDGALEWLRDETRRVAARLKSTETQIDAFLHSKGIVRGQVASIASEQLSSLSQQLAIAQADRASAAGKMQQASNGGATSSVLENRAVGDVKQQLATVSAQVAQLSSRYGSANPALRELLDQKRGLEGMLGRETGLVNRSASADYQAANSRVVTLTQQIDGLKRDVRGNDNAETQMASLQRELLTDRELYLDLTKSLNQLETNRRLVTANAQLVALAELPPSVFFPKISTFAMTGLMLATALATITALLRDRADRTIRTVDGLEDATGLRVLARVPHVPRVGRGASLLVKRMQKPSAFQEAIRGLYAECMLLGSKRQRERRLRSLMICSAGTGEGKSFVTLALAHFAVGAGQRVLILECDLRRPSLARSLHLPPREGMTDILRGAVTATEAVVATRIPNLDVILAGVPAMDSTELLGHPRMGQVLEWAETRYDLVLIDTPPSRLLRDARILASEVDGILYCAQWGRSHTAAVLEGVAEIRADGGRVLGLVLDRLESEDDRLYGGRHQAGSYLIAKGD